jgi:AcrR family transcriptional regulator
MGLRARKQKETEALRQRVLDVAEDIVAREGVGNVTMRRIAASVDYAPTVLYRLFANKDDLMDHLIARGYSGVREKYEEVHSRQNLSPLAALGEILRVYTAYALDHPNHYRMWFQTSDIRLEGSELKMRHGRLEYVVFQAWLDRIDTCRKAGHFCDREPLEVFQTIWARVHGLISLRLQHPDFPWQPVAQHLDQVLGLEKL